MKDLSKKFKSTILKKDGKIKSNYASALNFRDNARCKFYPSYWVKNGGNYNLVDKSSQIIEVLKLAGYGYKLGNEAPRGGKEGDYIKVSKTAMNFVNELLTTKK